MNKTAACLIISFATPGKKWTVEPITINLASDEANKLDSYCNQTGRAATDVIRELIRGLPVS